MNYDTEVIVIGGGIIGASIAAALAEHKIDVILIDQGSCGGQGASAYSGGLVRCYDPDPLLTELAAHAIVCQRTTIAGRAFARALRRTGLVYRVPEAESDRVRDIIARGRELDYPMLPITEDQMRKMTSLPDATPRGLTLFEAQAGIGDVRMAIRHLVDLTRSRGLVIEHTQVTAIDNDGDNGTQVTAGKLGLRSRVCVVATGAWTHRLYPELGLQARSIPLARIMTTTDATMPVIDATVGVYAIPLSQRIVQVGSGIRHTGQIPEDLPETGAEQAEEAIARLSRLTGRAENGPAVNVLPGFDVYTSDGRPLLGFAKPDSAIYLATGTCGLGYKFVPAIADIAVRQIRRKLEKSVAPDTWAELKPWRLAGPINPELAGVQP